jgi:hypothetical protein
MKTPLITVILLLAMACSKPSEQAGSNDSTSTASAAAPADTTVNVVIWNEVGVRDTPSDKGKYLTTIYLGEKFELVGDTASEVVGAKRNHFHKIKLSDASTGWVRDELVALHVAPAAVMTGAVICKRPDHATVTDQAFSIGDFVVVRKVEGNFYEVTGKRVDQKWFSNGYISKDYISFKPIEVEFAAMITRANDPTTNEKVRNALLLQLQDQSVFGQSGLWYQAYYTGDEEYAEGDDVEEGSDPADTTSVENN